MNNENLEETQSNFKYLCEKYSLFLQIDFKNCEVKFIFYFRLYKQLDIHN
jgi:hypothetical protein